MKRGVGLIVLLALVVAPSVTAAGGAGVGDAAPDFTLADQDGNQVTLSKIEGVRVLEWINPDCPFVKRHYKAGTMKTLALKYRAEGVTWLTINSTNYMDSADNKKFRDGNELPQPILVDQDGTVGHLYGAATTPHMFVIDPSGTIVYEGAIDDDPRGSKSDGATNYVAAALDETLSGASVSTKETMPYGCSVKYKK